MEAKYLKRCQELWGQVQQAGCDGILVTDPANVRYLSGFTGDSTFLLLNPNNRILISDSRFATQISQECAGFDLEIRDASQSTEELSGRVIRKTASRKLAIEADHLTKATYDRLSGQLDSVLLVDTTGLVKTLRAIKDSEEIETIRQSIRIAEQAIGVLLTQLEGKQTEQQIAADLEYQIRLSGGEGCSFSPIVAVGPHAALPHARPGPVAVSDSDFVLIDWGAKVSGYCSDLTRVYTTGKISPKFRQLFEVVISAQSAAIELIRPGVALREVDSAARSVIAQAGFDEYFGHGLGHGIGLEIHELPRLAPSAEGVLEAGMIVTVEPGVYLPGFAGVRIEDDVLVTAEGAEVLSSSAKDLDACRIELY